MINRWKDRQTHMNDYYGHLRVNKRSKIIKKTNQKDQLADRPTNQPIDRSTGVIAMNPSCKSWVQIRETRQSIQWPPGYAFYWKLINKRL